MYADQWDITLILISYDKHTICYLFKRALSLTCSLFFCFCNVLKSGKSKYPALLPPPALILSLNQQTKVQRGLPKPSKRKGLYWKEYWEKGPFSSNLLQSRCRHLKEFSALIFY